jgi:hypothetical protein
MVAQPTAVARPSTPVVFAGLVFAVVVATALNAAAAALAHASGASHAFQPLQIRAYGTLTVMGLLAGAAGWAIIRARTSNPRRLLRIVAPTVLIISFIPDLQIGANATEPGTSWGAVGVLMLMHLIVAAVAIPTYMRTMPLLDVHR